MPVRSPLFSVPKGEVDTVLKEIELRAEARRRIKPKAVYNPELGETPEEAEDYIEQMRRDVGTYGTYVFGLPPARVHKFWNTVADDVINRKVRQNKLLIIAPPNTAKSTWNSQIRPVHYLGQHPDHNLLFFTSSDPMAKTFHSTVENTLRENPRHREVFPAKDCRPNRARGWSGDGLYLYGTPFASKDPAYHAVGFGATIMGARAHGIILDDPLNQQQAQSETEQRRAKAYYDQTLVPRLQPREGWVLAVMTRWHENDLASHLIELAEKSGDWIVINTPMIAIDDGPDPLGRRPGELLWPERFDAEFVAAEQARMATAEFNMVHQGDPTGMGGDVFKDERWFQPLPEDFWSRIYPECRIVQAWDLAFSEKDKTCFTVGVTAAVDRALNIYIVHVIRQRYTIGQTEDVMVRAIQTSKPLVVAIEEDSFHQQLIRAFAQRLLGRVMVNLQLAKPDKDKVSRALLPAARAEAGKVFISKTSSWYRRFVAECLGFPNTKYKDQVDAFSLIAQVVQQLGQAVQREKTVEFEVAV